MLGGSTKHYKTYGKRKVNVVNKRVTLGDTTGNNNNGSTRTRLQSNGWSDSSSNDSSESDSDEVVRTAPVRRKALPTQKISIIAKNRDDSAQNKENSSATGTSVLGSKPVKSAQSRKVGKAKVEPDAEGKPTQQDSSDTDFQPRAPLRMKQVLARGQSKSKFVRVFQSESDLEHVSASVPREEARPGPIDELSNQEAIYSDQVEEEEAEEDSENNSCVAETIGAQPERVLPSLSPLPFPSKLSSLLALSLSPESRKPYDFSSFVEAPLSPFAFASTGDKPWRKVGEASYSEVFATTAIDGEEIVVKVIPIAPIGSSYSEDLGDEPLPDSSDWESVKREIEISGCLGGTARLDGFVRFRGAFIVQGSYPDSLLSAWDRFKANQKPACDDQIRPSILPPSQMYALILLDHAGTDLETWKLRNWKEAKEIWDQVVERLGQAEQDLEFEHRDLHWGNILVAPAPPPPSPIQTLPQEVNSLSLTPRTSQTPLRSKCPLPTVKATIIDFTLSRLQQPPATPTSARARLKPKANVLYDPFADDCIFEGEGDLQFDVYRGMRTIVGREGGGWESFHPRTNLLWLHYLVSKLLYSKRLKTPSLPPTATTTLVNASLGSFASPSRAVSSPRMNRRHSLVFSGSALPSSPLAERKSRTLPTSSSLAKQYRVLSDKQRKQMVEEVDAWESLKSALEKLNEILGDLLEPDNHGLKPRIRKPVGKSSRSRGGKAVKKVEEQVEGERQGAREFWQWCQSSHR